MVKSLIICSLLFNPANAFAPSSFNPSLQHSLQHTLGSSRGSVDPGVALEPEIDDDEWLPTFSLKQHQELKRMNIQVLRAPPLTDASIAKTTSSTSSPSDRDILVARLLLLAAAALYGTNFSLVKLLGETDIPVGLSSALRFGMAALATSPWLLPSNNKDDWKAVQLGLEVGLWNSVGYVAQAVGLETTAASKSAFICSLAVVTVPLLDYAVGKTLLPRQTLGALLALAGVGVLELGGGDISITPGDWASLVQPICFGIGFWRMEAAMQQYPHQANRSTAAQLLAVFGGSLLYASIVDADAFTVSNLTNWLSDSRILMALIWTGCISTALTVYMETLALKTLSAAETTLIFSTEPLWGTAFAALVLGETLGWQAGVGAVLILGGCLVSNMDGLTNILSSSVDSMSSKNNKNWIPVGTAVVAGAALVGVWNDLSAATKYTLLQLEGLLSDN